MTDLSPLLARLDRHWITASFPTGPLENPHVMAKDCKEAADAIRALQDTLQKAVSDAHYFADTAIRLAKE